MILLSLKDLPVQSPCLVAEFLSHPDNITIGHLAETWCLLQTGPYHHLRLPSIHSQAFLPEPTSVYFTLLPGAKKGQGSFSVLGYFRD